MFLILERNIRSTFTHDRRRTLAIWWYIIEIYVGDGTLPWKRFPDFFMFLKLVFPTAHIIRGANVLQFHDINLLTNLIWTAYLILTLKLNHCLLPWFNLKPSYSFAGWNLVWIFVQPHNQASGWRLVNYCFKVKNYLLILSGYLIFLFH